MFERLSEAAARVLFFTRHEASELGIPSITPELLLLGLVREPKGLLSDILASAGLVRDDVRREIIEHTLSREDVGRSKEIPFTETAERVVVCASEQSNRMHHTLLHPEHLLLGLLSERGTLAASLLEKQGSGSKAFEMQSCG
jgi:ATP-dependent Clp protease ATP-binding subunit ClpA